MALPPGTVVTFRRGTGWTWEEIGHIRKVQRRSYVIEARSGDLFVRPFAEVETAGSNDISRHERSSQ